ncbi:nuclear transport factor 2 family protein [Frankia sp. AgKG'84/4]|uniref:nuclear transport factor 2 family protein n=1 Tax=Frankia sp. AgKG'84/4 TaxID=573490 RepID=UPI00200C15F9|nr:nuclear transport factor 2 family protein [Frankia sp. AgKG'84/4]MCL9794165.1 nuclear transport factor 2 family protein [Frankia sp. AgKG'84/4]
MHSTPSKPAGGATPTRPSTSAAPAAELSAVLDRLAADSAIRRTYFHFFRLSDLAQYERLGQRCFTADASIQYRVMPGPPQRFAGRDEFVAFMVAGRPPGGAAFRLASPTVAHTSAPADIDWSSGEPRLTGYATVWHWAATRTVSGRHRPADWTTIGLVEDTYRQDGGQWLIARRRVSPAAGLVATGAAPGGGRRTDR